jgi:hypothetical protein
MVAVMVIAMAIGASVVGVRALTAKGSGGVARLSGGVTSAKHSAKRANGAMSFLKVCEKDYHRAYHRGHDPPASDRHLRRMVDAQVERVAAAERSARCLGESLLPREMVTIAAKCKSAYYAGAAHGLRVRLLEYLTLIDSSSTTNWEHFNMRYEEVPELDRKCALQEIKSGNPERAARGLLALAYDDPDWEWVLNLCSDYANDPDENIRGIALLCFSHLERVHGALILPIVLPALVKAIQGDSSEWVQCKARDALGDLVSQAGGMPYERRDACKLMRSDQVDEALLGLCLVIFNEADSDFAIDTCKSLYLSPVEIVRHHALLGIGEIVNRCSIQNYDEIVAFLNRARTEGGSDAHASEASLFSIRCKLDDGE